MASPASLLHSGPVHASRTTRPLPSKTSHMDPPQQACLPTCQPHAAFPCKQGHANGNGLLIASCLPTCQAYAPAVIFAHHAADQQICSPHTSSPHMSARSTGPCPASQLLPSAVHGCLPSTITSRVLSCPHEPPTVAAPTLVTSSLLSSAFLHTCREMSSLTNGTSTSPAGTYQLPPTAARGSHRKHASSWPSWFQLMSTSLA